MGIKLLMFGEIGQATPKPSWVEEAFQKIIWFGWIIMRAF